MRARLRRSGSTPPAFAGVAITEDMKITFEREDNGGEGGGPRRGFKANKDVTRPSCDAA